MFCLNSEGKSNLPNCLLLKEWHNNFTINSSDKNKPLAQKYTAIIVQCSRHVTSENSTKRSREGHRPLNEFLTEIHLLH